VAKVPPHLQSAYAAEVCGGLGVLTSIKQIMTDGDSLRKVDLMLGSDCQSAMHKFDSSHRVVSFDPNSAT